MEKFSDRHFDRIAKEVFLAALELLRKGFTKGAAARTALGLSVLPNNSEAVRWCSIGATQRATLELANPAQRAYIDVTSTRRVLPRDSMCVYSRIFAVLQDAMQGDGVADFNDRHTQAEVIAAWEQAGRAKGWIV